MYLHMHPSRSEPKQPRRRISREAQGHGFWDTSMGGMPKLLVKNAAQFVFVKKAGCWVLGGAIRVQGFGFRVEGFGFGNGE